MSTETPWEALQDALRFTEPACMGDERFTAETGDHDAVLRKICDSCLVKQQCREFGKTAPRGRAWGYFGGIIRRTKPQVRARRRAALPAESVMT